MGYRGKVEERARARELRARSWTLEEIAFELGVAKSSVSTWVRDVEFVPKPRNRGNGVTRPHPAHLAKLAEIDEMNRWGAAQIGQLTDKEFLVAGAALSWGEGTKSGKSLSVANTDPEVIRFFMAWARRFFEIDESRWRGMLYLHDGLDLEAATAHRTAVAGIPQGQFTKPYRAVPDVGIRHNKHEFGCFTARYTSTRVARAALGLYRGLIASRGPAGIPG